MHRFLIAVLAVIVMDPILDAEHFGGRASAWFSGHASSVTWDEFAIKSEI